MPPLVPRPVQMLVLKQTKTKLGFYFVQHVQYFFKLFSGLVLQSWPILLLNKNDIFHFFSSSEPVKEYAEDHVGLFIAAV